MSLSIFSLSLLIHESKPKRIVFYACAFGLMMLGLIFTQTRGAIGAFAIVFVWALVFSKKRKALWIIAALGFVVLLFQTELWLRVLMRFTGGGEGHITFLEGLRTRFAVWDIIIHNWSPLFFITGMGMTTVRYLFQATAHNTYIGAFVYCGIPGLITLFLCVRYPFKLCASLNKKFKTNHLSRALSMALKMLIVAFLISGMVLENFQQFRWMQFLFMIIVLAEKQKYFMSLDTLEEKDVVYAW